MDFSIANCFTERELENGCVELLVAPDFQSLQAKHLSMYGAVGMQWLVVSRTLLPTSFERVLRDAVRNASLVIQVLPKEEANASC